MSVKAPMDYHSLEGLRPTRTSTALRFVPHRTLLVDPLGTTGPGTTLPSRPNGGEHLVGPYVYTTTRSVTVSTVEGPVVWDLGELPLDPRGGCVSPLCAGSYNASCGQSEEGHAGQGPQTG